MPPQIGLVACDTLSRKLQCSDTLFAIYAIKVCKFSTFDPAFSHKRDERSSSCSQFGRKVAGDSLSRVSFRAHRIIDEFRFQRCL